MTGAIARQLWPAIGLVLLATVFRLLPHPPNFTPLGAIGLFAGCYLSLPIAVLLPLLAMLLSDLWLGLHPLMPFVYGALALSVWLGRQLPTQRNAVTALAGAAVLAAVCFFLISNLGVWLLGNMYPPTWTGLWLCYLAALPFFANHLVANLLFSALLFGAARLLALPQTSRALPQ